MKPMKPAYTTPMLRAILMDAYEDTMYGRRTYQPGTEKSVDRYVMAELRELATFVGYMHGGLTMGSGRPKILRDILFTPLRERYMSLEMAVSLYNKRSDSKYFSNLNRVEQQVVMLYPNKTAKLTLQRNRYCKYGVCSSLVGGVLTKRG
ncbi:hypothetical protein [Vibrio phage VCPH]|nr:hypothetical protein [Vibrio phage VCPH]